MWRRYIDDTFIVWKYGPEELSKVVMELSGVHEQFQVTIEMEQNNKLAFLDILIAKHADEILSRSVYQKTTFMHTAITIQL